MIVFIQLPDKIGDTLTSFSGKSGKRALLTFCKRESVHQSWKIMLDDQFLDAYKYGMVVNCADGVRRLLFPRIFTYSADYPEKYVI